MSDKDRGYKSLVLDVVHIVFSVITVILSILVFLDTEDNKAFFPIIFMSLVIICIMQLVKIYRGLSTYRYKRFATYAFAVLSIFFVIFSIIALISL